MEFAYRAVPEPFKHQPLNHAAQSIRLIEIQSELSAGSFLQCTIRHATIDDEYICLSYRWGAPSPMQQILINGQPFMVRQNLFDFLSMMREKNTNVPYWIDAVCIDQSNVAERNHQVAQMGKIFAGALSVHAWLGRVPDLLLALAALQDPEKTTMNGWALVRSQKDALEAFLCDNEYWNRAWVIQEIFLAKTVVVWADSVALAFDTLHWSIDYFYLSWKDTPLAQFKLFTTAIPQAHSRWIAFSEAKRLYYGASLTTLLANFSNKLCEVPRDRIFSLLSMCGDGRDVSVDYSTSDEQVALDVLRCCTGWRCLCVPLLVSRCLTLRKGHQLPKVGMRLVSPFLELSLKNLTVAGKPNLRPFISTLKGLLTSKPESKAVRTWRRLQDIEASKSERDSEDYSRRLLNIGDSCPNTWEAGFLYGSRDEEMHYFPAPVSQLPIHRRKVREHRSIKFRYSGRYFEVHEIGLLGEVENCLPIEQLMGRLYELRYITEMSGCQYLRSGCEECTRSITREVLECLVKGTALYVEEIKTLACSYPNSNSYSVSYKLPDGIILEPEAPGQSWRLRITLWALREMMAPVDNLCNMTASERDLSSSSAISHDTAISIHSDDMYRRRTKPWFRLRFFDRDRRTTWSSPFAPTDTIELSTYRV